MSTNSQKQALLVGAMTIYGRSGYTLLTDYAFTVGNSYFLFHNEIPYVRHFRVS
jgi:hypothetical protein